MKNITTPEFSNEADERQYWETEDSSEIIDWSQAQQVVFPNLKPSFPQQKVINNMVMVLSVDYQTMLKKK